MARTGRGKGTGIRFDGGGREQVKGPAAAVPGEGRVGNRELEQKTAGPPGPTIVGRVALFACGPTRKIVAETSSERVPGGVLPAQPNAAARNFLIAMTPPRDGVRAGVARNLQRVRQTARIMDIPALCLTPGMPAYTDDCVCKLLYI